MWSAPLSRLVLQLLCLVCILGRPAPPSPADLKLISNVETLQDSDLIGANIDSFLSTMYNNLIKTRLENLLQGVDLSHQREGDASFSLEKIRGEQLSSRDIAQELDSRASPVISREGESEVFLPAPVTNIPLKLFTSLPGTL